LIDLNQPKQKGDFQNMKTQKTKEPKNETTETIPAQPEVIADVTRSETEVIRISKREFKGVLYLDLRVFFKDKAGEYRPTKKGLTIKKDQVHEVAQAVSIAEERMAA